MGKPIETLAVGSKPDGNSRNSAPGGQRPLPNDGMTFTARYKIRSSFIAVGKDGEAAGFCSLTGRRGTSRLAFSLSAIAAASSFVTTLVNLLS
jgi:hypothetical protein